MKNKLKTSTNRKQEDKHCRLRLHLCPEAFVVVVVLKSICSIKKIEMRLNILVVSVYLFLARIPIEIVEVGVVDSSDRKGQP